MAPPWGYAPVATLSWALRFQTAIATVPDVSMRDNTQCGYVPQPTDTQFLACFSETTDSYVLLACLNTLELAGGIRTIQLAN